MYFKKVHCKFDCITVNFDKTQHIFSTFLGNFFLCQDCVQGDVPPHLAQPCYMS